MKQRYILYRRKNGKFYAEDTTTKKQESLKTSDKAEAFTLLHSKNEAARQPALNLRIAKAYLTATDSTFATRTWQHVLDEIIRTKTGSNQDRWKVMAKSKWFNPIRNRLLIETQCAYDYSDLSAVVDESFCGRQFNRTGRNETRRFFGSGHCASGWNDNYASDSRKCYAIRNVPHRQHDAAVPRNIIKKFEMMDIH